MRGGRVRSWSVVAASPRGRAVAAVGVLAAAVATPAANASGETRTLTFHHTHTKETATVTYRRDGAYDQAGLQQLNWLLRDWRVDTPVAMDPRLFDILWDLYREAGSREPIHVISAYRSPGTNDMLRQRSGAVAEHSQHMSGKAIDVRLPDVDPARMREIAMRLQQGGVGYYAASGFVHIDTGSVRAWPRMSEGQLARLFPDGKTVHLPASGKPLPGYEQARAEIAQRAGAAGPVAAGAVGGPDLLAFLGRVFGAGQIPQATSPAVLANAEAGAAVAPDAAPAATAVAALDPAAAVPLPPRRPAVALVQAAATWPLATLPWLPAPDRPQMDWPEPDDGAAVLRAVLTAGGGAANPVAARLVTVRVVPRPTGADPSFGESDPASRFAGGFAKSADRFATAPHSGPTGAPAARAREANARR